MIDDKWLRERTRSDCTISAVHFVWRSGELSPWVATHTDTRRYLGRYRSFM